MLCLYAVGTPHQRFTHNLEESINFCIIKSCVHLSTSWKKRPMTIHLTFQIVSFLLHKKGRTLTSAELIAGGDITCMPCVAQRIVPSEEVHLIISKTKKTLHFPLSLNLAIFYDFSYFLLLNYHINR